MKRMGMSGAMLLLAGLVGCSGGPSSPTFPSRQPAETARGSSSATNGNSETGAVSGTLKIAGSDTMVNLAKLWEQGYKKEHPNVSVEVEGKGSGTAPPLLTQGAATFGDMSREMKKAEIEEFQKNFSYPPTGVPVAWDMLAVYVNKDNPIARQGLTLKQVDAIFSKNRKRGGEKDITKWGDLGLTGEWADKPITLYGRNAASGTYGYFKEHVLKTGDYKDSVKEQPGSSAVVKSVGEEKYAIGYSGIGYKTADVAAVPLTEGSETPPKFVSAEPQNKDKYPLARMLYVYVNKAPGKPLDPLRASWMNYILGPKGQADVVTEGYLKLDPEEDQEAMKLVK